LPTKKRIDNSQAASMQQKPVTRKQSTSKAIGFSLGQKGAPSISNFLFGVGGDTANRSSFFDKRQCNSVQNSARLIKVLLLEGSINIVYAHCYRPVFYFYIAKRANRRGKELVMLSGKSAIVTGSTSGIGLGIAQVVEVWNIRRRSRRIPSRHCRSVSEYFVVMRLESLFLNGGYR
jgi:hypothetical protein